MLFSLAACHSSTKFSSSRSQVTGVVVAQSDATGTSVISPVPPTAVPVAVAPTSAPLTATVLTAQPIIDKFQACLAAGNLWLPPPDATAANAAGVCGDPVLPWSCAAGALGSRISVYTSSGLDKTISDLQSRGFQIYGCSAAKDGSLDINLLNASGSKLTYHKVNFSIEALDGAASLLDQTGDKAPCTALFSSIVDQAVPAVPAPAAAASNFPAINALLTANCGNASCHAATATAQLALVGNESLVRAQAQAIIAQLNQRLMPVGNRMSDADRQSLISLLQGN